MTSITVFYSSSDSINRSYTEIYKALARRADPSIRIIDVSSVTLAEVVELSRTSDLVAVDNFIKVAHAIAPTEMHSVMMRTWRGPEFYADVWNSIFASGVPVLYIASGWDLHWPGPNFEEFLPKLAAIAWFFEAQPVLGSDVFPAYRDEWMNLHSDPISVWEKVRTTVPVRIELMHSLGPREFLATPKRSMWEVCVAGESYHTRLMARSSAEQAGLKLAPYSLTNSLLIHATAKLPFILNHALASKTRNFLRQYNQTFLTSHAAINFVCGSGYRYPVRKYFEIPALRSAMLAYPCVGMRDYGFVDGKNFIQIAPEDFGREAQRIFANEPLREKLVKDAWATVYRLHRAEQRAEDLITCLRRLAQGRLRLASFKGGEFVIE